MTPAVFNLANNALKSVFNPATSVAVESACVTACLTTPFTLDVALGTVIAPVSLTVIIVPSGIYDSS